MYGESAIVPVAMVAKYPEKLLPQEGTAIWMQYITAYGALVEYGQIKAGDFVLISAASSSVGIAAIQITKAQGATAIATTRGESKKQMLLDNGADYVIVTKKSVGIYNIEFISRCLSMLLFCRIVLCGKKLQKHPKINKFRSYKNYHD